MPNGPVIVMPHPTPLGTPERSMRRRRRFGGPQLVLFRHSSFVIPHCALDVKGRDKNEATASACFTLAYR